ncbi:MAG: DUF748 domain-containing protein [Pseudomonadota bacterium]
MPVWLKNTLLIYVSYLGFCLFFILPVLNLAPHWFLDREYQRELSSKFIYFNPFSNGLVAHDVALKNPDNSDFLDFERAEVNLSLSSIWQSGWVLDRVQLGKLNLSVVRNSEGAFNFDDFLASEPAPAPVAEPASEEAGIPGVTIAELDLSSQRLSYLDASRAEPYSTYLDDLAIYVTELSTVLVEGKPYSLKAKDEAGGELYWEGLVSVPTSTSSGSLRLSNISLLPAWRFIAPWVNFELASGALSIEGEYDVEWGDALAYRLQGGVLEVSEFEITPQAGVDIADTRVALDALAITDINVDSQGSVEVGSIELREPILEGWSDGETFSLLQMLDTSGFPAGEPEDDQAEDAAPGIEWQAKLKGSSLINGRISWRSNFTDPPMTTIAPVDVAIGEVNWPFAGDTSASLQITVNEKSRLGTEGAIALEDGTGEFSFNFEDLHLPRFSPAIPDALQATLDSGTANAQGTIALADYSPTTVNMDGNIRELQLTLSGEEQALTGWEALHLEGLAVSLEKQHVNLDTLRLTGYAGRLHIYEDGSINSSKVLQQELEAADVDVDEAAEAAQAWGYDIGSIQMTESQVDFMDESLPIVFRTVIGDLGGEITGLSSDPTKTANIDFAGSVDGYAPVNLAGNARPMAQPPALDLGLGFEGLDLARLTPYSGTYAGYAIERGVMTLNVRYSLDEGRLDGDNKLVIDQLKLGEKIDSDKAVNVPLQLGISLLTDANGVIDLSVPVSGDINDPEFSLGSVIAGAFINLITKAATAPFNLLAGLVGSEEDLQRVNFAAGSTSLDGPAQQKLASLAEAFAQRPQLTLLIDGRVNPELDRVRLQKNDLAAQFIAEGISEDEVKAKGPEWTAAIEARYAALGLPLADDAGQPVSVRNQYEAVAASINIPDSSLQTLAEERDVETKRYLVNDLGMDAERSVIDSVDLTEENHTFSGVEMDVD